MLPDAATLAAMNSGVPETSDKVGLAARPHADRPRGVLSSITASIRTAGCSRRSKPTSTASPPGRASSEPLAIIYAQFRWPDGDDHSDDGRLRGDQLVGRSRIVWPDAGQTMQRQQSGAGRVHRPRRHVLRFLRGQGCIPYGEHEPGCHGIQQQWQERRRRAGLGSGRRQGAGEQILRQDVGRRVHREYETGHTGCYFQEPVVAAGSGPRRATMPSSPTSRETSWLFDLARKWDGSFAYNHIYTHDNYGGFNPQRPTS